MMAYRKIRRNHESCRPRYECFLVLASRCQYEHVECKENYEAAHTKDLPEAVTIVERLYSVHLVKPMQE